MLKRESPGDVGFFTKQRKRRFTSLFPKIYTGAFSSTPSDLTPTSCVTGSQPPTSCTGTSQQTVLESDSKSKQLALEFRSNTSTPVNPVQTSGVESQTDAIVTQQQCTEVESDMSIHLGDQDETRQRSRSRMSTVREADSGDEDGECNGEKFQQPNDDDKYLDPTDLIALCGGKF